LKSVSKPDNRVVPKPRFREKQHQITRITPMTVQKINVSRIKIEPIEDIKTDHHHNRISLPDLPGAISVAGFAVPALPSTDSTLDIGSHDSQVEFTNAGDYFEMLNLRIQKEKKYPEDAKSRHQEGRVNIQFVLLQDGTLSNIKIIKRSRHRNLNKAALEAIKKASPFPKPPPYIVNTPATLKISILFELA